MVNHFSSTIPAFHADGSISAIVRDVRPLPPAGVLMRLWLPVAYDSGGGFGRFFLARCTEDTLDARRTEWSIYSRRALFCAGMPVAMPDVHPARSEQAGSSWDFVIPANPDPRYSDPGHRWLAQRPQATSINLLGPFGQPFELAAHSRALLVLAGPHTLPFVLPVVQLMLDRAGRVTLLILGEAEDASALMPLIPLPVEVRMVAEASWLDELAEPVRWADQLCAALPNHQISALAHRVRTLRFQLDTQFAHVLVTADLLCGVGACLACVVATRDSSYTRACVHGPVFSLTSLA
jgi:dihydroorotate dehydrogenase electron transfer subunit